MGSTHRSTRTRRSVRTGIKVNTNEESRSRRDGLNSTTSLSQMGHAALSYVNIGWDVLPCREHTSGSHKGKAPYTANGFHDASNNVSQIIRWWQQWPDALIGLAIPPHVVVIDLDHPAALADLEAINGGKLPETLTATTGRAEGGTHYYYTADTRSLSQAGIRDREGHLIDGVDVRIGGRGYVIAPPSKHPDTGTPYKWTNTAPAAQLPSALADAMTPIAPRPQALYPITTGTPDKSLDGLLRRMARATKGERNIVLCELAPVGVVA